MTRNSSEDRKSAVHSLLKVQCWLGIWKWEDENVACNWLKRTYPYILHLPLTFTQIALMWLEVMSSDDLEQVGRVMYMSLTMLPLMIKVINILYRGEEAAQLVHELDDCAKHEDLQIFEREQGNFKRIYLLYIGGSYAVALIGFISVLLQDEYEMPFGYYVPFEWHNPRGYLLAWSYNVLAVSLCCLCNVCLDTTYCFFMFQLGLLYRFLNIRLLALQQAPEHEALPELRRIFRTHQRLHRLTRQCQQLVSPYVASQVILSAFIICFSGYRLVQMGWQQNPGLFLATLQFEAVMVLQIFLPCYYGNQLTINANQLTNSVFHTNWLEYSVKTRKELICYMEFLKRPVKVRAGVFFEIGLPIFMKVRIRGEQAEASKCQRNRSNYGKDSCIVVCSFALCFKC